MVNKEYLKKIVEDAGHWTSELSIFSDGFARGSRLYVLFPTEAALWDFLRARTGKPRVQTDGHSIWTFGGRPERRGFGAAPSARQGRRWRRPWGDR